MASKEQLIFDLLTGKNTLTPTLTKSEKQSKKITTTLTKGLGGAFRGITKSAFNLKTAIVGLGGAFAVGGAINQAKELENALIGLQSVARNTGQDVGFITNAAKELSADGLIPLQDVSDSLKNLLATGLDGQKAIEVFKALRQSAAFNRQGQLELGEAIKGAAEGLKNDLSIKVDNAGITKNLSNIQKEYAQSIGKSVADLTDAERAQAKYVGIIKEARVFQGDYNRLLETFSGAQSKASGESRFLVAEFGSFITQSPTAVALIGQIGESFKKLRVFLEQNRESIQVFINEGIAGLVNLAPTFISGVELIATGYLKIGRVVLATTDNILEFYKVIADTEAFKTFAEFGVQAFGFIADGWLQLFETIVGTGIGGKIAEALGFDPEEIKTSLNEAKEGLMGFVADFDGGDIAEGLDKASNKVKQAFIFNEENLESLQEGFDQAKQITQDFANSVADADNNVTRLSIDGSKKRKDANANENADKEKSNKKFYDFSVNAEKLTGKQRVANLKSTLGTISSLTSSSNKELFAIGKASAISLAIIDGISAVQKALTAAPPPFNFALAALVGVATAANVAKIASSKPPGAQTGGILDPNGSSTAGDLLPFRGNSGEAILTKGQQARFVALADGAEPRGAGDASLVEELRALRDDLTSLLSSQSIEANGREIARVVRDEVRGGFALG